MQGIAESAGMMQEEKVGWEGEKREKGVWESRGMSRPSMIFCLVGCDQKNDQNWKLGRSGGRAVGVQERSGVVQKDVQGCVVEQRGGRSTLRCLLSNLRAPRFWPSDVVCGGGATGRVSFSLGPGDEGTSSTAAPPLLCILLLGVGLKILHRPNPFLASSGHIHHLASQIHQQQQQGLAGLAGQDWMPVMAPFQISSHLISPV